MYDVSDKTAPINKGIYPMSIPNGLGYKGDYLFICDEGADRLEVYDISNPLELQHLAGYSISMTDPYDLIVDGNKMIVSTKTDFQLFDLSELPLLKRAGLILK